MVVNKMKKYQKAQMTQKDARAKLMNEILNGIKILKLYAWEPSFSLNIIDIRAREIDGLKKAAYLDAVSTFLWICAPFLVSLSSFAVFVLSSEKNILDAQTAFVSLTYFNLLKQPLNLLPSQIVSLVQTFVSIDRINAFLNSEELDPMAVGRDEQFPQAVYLENASFTWEEEQGLEQPQIKGIVEQLDHTYTNG